MFDLIDTILLPILIIILLGVGLYLTILLRFIQFRKLGRGLSIVRGLHDDPDQSGEVNHFQALTTALSATVGIGNISGVALAIHWGGPGALFWMWVTAILGMATKYSEVTLAQAFRVHTSSGVAGGPMYYIEKGLGKNWKPVALFTAFFLMLTAFLSGNAIQANTIADTLFTEFQIPVFWTGLLLSIIIFAVIVGGIKRIGRVTSILAPFMALFYVLGGITILVINIDLIVPTLSLIIREAFQPTAGVAGTGAGVFIQTLSWGVRRGLFSNEAGQGSASVAHAAAKSSHPVKEGLVALLEPFIDTILICTITGLVIITTGVWKTTTPTALFLNSGDLSYMYSGENQGELANISLKDGYITSTDIAFIWHEVPVQQFYEDEAQVKPFSGVIYPDQQLAVTTNQDTLFTLYGEAAENGAPLTKLAFEKGLGKIGGYLVLLSVLLFGISTAISWNYYGDRCIQYIAGTKAVIPYKIVYACFHFVGAISSLNFIWNLGDTTLALVTIPNVIALFLLSGKVKKLTKEYFEQS